MSHHNQKTDTTAQLYCTLSTYVTPKTISRQNQETNTTPQLYCTLSTKVCKTKTYFPPQTKNWHNSTSGKKVPPAHAQRVYSFLCPSFCLSVRAKRGIWSKRVLIRKIDFFSVCIEGILRLFTIFHFHRKFLIFLRNNHDCKAVEAPNIFEKLSWL
jgi:hypothetical protein